MTTTGTGASELVYVALQRAWAGDTSNIARVGVYDPTADAWSFFGYPLDPGANDPGLSEIVALDDQNFVVIERDGSNGSVDPPALFKLVKTFSVSRLTPEPNPDGTLVPVPEASYVTPVQRFDLVGSTPGDDLEKWECLVVKDDWVYAAIDNDGAGETRLVSFEADLLTD